MESSAFTQDTADPFGDDGMGDFPTGPSDLATEEPVAGIPLVGADGEPVDAATQDEPFAATTPIQQREDAVAEAAAVSTVGSDGGPIPTTPAVHPDNDAAEADRAERAAQDPTSATASSEEPGEAAGPEDPTPGGSPASETQEPQREASPAAQDAAAPAESDGSDSPTPASATAEPPQEVTGKNGEKTHRRYVLLAAEGDGKFSEVHWYEDKAGKVVSKGQTGAKKQTVCLARGQDDALAMGWRAMGSPANGCSLIAVAAGYFQVKHVGPDQEPPTKPRLRIS